MLPKFSIAARRLTITLFCAIRFAPWARFILIIAGKSCGVSPTANASENKNESSTGRFRYTLMAKIATTSMSVTSSKKYPKYFTPCSNSVSGALSFRLSETLPNSVSLPVRTITAFALPLTTCAPINRVFLRLARGVSAGTTPGSFSTG